MVPRESIQAGILGCTNSSSDDDAQGAEAMASKTITQRRHSFGAQTLKGLQDVNRQQRELWKPALDFKPKETLEVGLMMHSGSSSSDDGGTQEAEPQPIQPRRVSLGSQTLRGVSKVLEKQVESNPERRGSGMPKEALAGVAVMLPDGDESDSDEPTVDTPAERRSSFGSQTLRGMKDVTRKQQEAAKRNSKGSLGAEVQSSIMHIAAHVSNDDDDNDDDDNADESFSEPFLRHCFAFGLLAFMVVFWDQTPYTPTAIRTTKMQNSSKWPEAWSQSSPGV
eukprot:gnl/MRDRNA2_/MRDRNA2_121511_c0_seq1.p1 gnl/MRDRNA2_/MRDRNA2_121511_c0~~gnl/MRDRNA2_/MRDRNA2_121511_c0_seq1.p1  ORF type:complete len:314 (+),score=62.03 gnl/MRDRNA2_/MRDRNA2_121511_c0_seq1:104-943(+)